MSSEILIGGEYKRPHWNHTRIRGIDKFPGHPNAELEMLESIRNVLEDIQRAQTLQCDVAHAIKDMAKTLRRIDRRFAKVKELKLP